MSLPAFGFGKPLNRGVDLSELAHRAFLEARAATLPEEVKRAFVEVSRFKYGHGEMSDDKPVQRADTWNEFTEALGKGLHVGAHWWFSCCEYARTGIGPLKPKAVTALVLRGDYASCFRGFCVLRDRNFGAAIAPSTRPGDEEGWILIVYMGPVMLDSSERGRHLAQVRYAWLAGVLSSLADLGKESYRLSAWAEDRHQIGAKNKTDTVHEVGGLAVDLDAWLRATGFDAFWQKAEADIAARGVVPPPTPIRAPEKRGLVEINEADPVEIQRDAAIEALASRQDIFVQYGRLVDVVGGKVRELPAGHLLALLTGLCAFTKEHKNGTTKSVPPSRAVVEAVLQKGEWPQLRELRRVSEIPLLLPDGRIFSDGYCAEKKVLIYAPPSLTGLRISEHPSREEAIKAAEKLLQFSKGFNVNEQGRSAWLALLLTLAGRSAFDGTAPMFCFDAPENQSGKSAAVKVAFGLVFGRKPKDQEFTEREEPDKRSAQWSGQPLIFLDNAPNGYDVGSASLDRLLTGGESETRILGHSKGVDVDLSGTTFALTGNNLTYKGDTASRVVVARFDIPLSREYDFNPEDHSFYDENAPSALAAALTILRAFIRAGRPKAKLSFNRFRGWSAFVRSAIVWLGLLDPVDSNVIVDRISETRREVHLALYAYLAYGVDVDVERWFKPSEIPVDREELAGLPSEKRILAVQLQAQLSGSREGKTIKNAADVGYALSKLRGSRVIYDNGVTTRLEYKQGRSTSLYRLVVTQPAPVEAAPDVDPETAQHDLTTSLADAFDEQGESHGD